MRARTTTVSPRSCACTRRAASNPCGQPCDVRFAGATRHAYEPFGDEHDPVAGDGQIVDRCGCCGDRPSCAGQRTGGDHNVVLRSGSGGREEVQITGCGIEFREPGESAGLAGEVDSADGVEIRREFVGQRSFAVRQDRASRTQRCCQRRCRGRRCAVQASDRCRVAQRQRRCSPSSAGRQCCDRRAHRCSGSRRHRWRRARCRAAARTAHPGCRRRQ